MYFVKTKDVKRFIFVWWIITQDIPLYFLLQILDKIVVNPSNLRCADCGMKGKT